MANESELLARIEKLENELNQNKDMFLHLIGFLMATHVKAGVPQGDVNAVLNALEKFNPDYAHDMDLLDASFKEWLDWKEKSKANPPLKK